VFISEQVGMWAVAMSALEWFVDGLPEKRNVPKFTDIYLKYT